MFGLCLVFQLSQLDDTFITGSLGGAMATCCAYDWVINRMPLTGVVTFGQPRVGNPMFARFMDDQIGARYIRFRNGEDIVPTVPPASSMFLPDYQHAGKLAWYRNGQWETRNLVRAMAGEAQGSTLYNIKGNKEITAEELFDLQRLLKANQTENEKNSVPDFLKNNQMPMRTGLRYGANDQFGSEVAPLSAKQYMTARGYSAKFGDHSMIEYLRFLNESRN